MKVAEEIIEKIERGMHPTDFLKIMMDETPTYYLR